MNKKHLYWLCGLLTAASLVIFAYKVMVLDFPLSPSRTAPTWQIEARVGFNGLNRPVLAKLRLPTSTPAKPVFREAFVTGRYGLTTRTEGENRVALFSIQRASGAQALYYRAVVQDTGRTEPIEPAPAPRLRRTPMTEVEQAAARALLDRLRPRSADIATLVAQLVAALQDSRAGGEAAMLLGGKTRNRDIVAAAVRVLQFDGIPARRVAGFELKDERRNARPIFWLEVYHNERWQPYSGINGAPGAPGGSFVWWRGNIGVLDIQGAADPRVTYSVGRTARFALDTALLRARQGGLAAAEFSLFGLPFQTQAVYRILMVVPVGIFLLVVLRNVVGVRTFGTFMPVLIAMAFRETNLLWGIILFCIVVFLGMSVRFYLEHLKLLLVPRLAAIVIVVIALMALLSVLTFRLGLERGLSVALFPIVILTMTIERMTVVWDERGAKESLTQAAGSLFVAVLCFLVMNDRLVEHLAFVFPELLMLMLAAVLMLGRYSGYRLTELTRFKVLARGEGP